MISTDKYSLFRSISDTQLEWKCSSWSWIGCWRFSGNSWGVHTVVPRYMFSQTTFDWHLSQVIHSLERCCKDWPSCCRMHTSASRMVRDLETIICGEYNWWNIVLKPTWINFHHIVSLFIESRLIQILIPSKGDALFIGDSSWAFKCNTNARSNLWIASKSYFKNWLGQQVNISIVLSVSNWSKQS